MEYLRLAYELALQSPDTSTQNGALLLDGNHHIIGEGVNEFTKGMEITPDLLERPKKYTYIEHAERNSIYDAMNRAPWDSRFDGPHAMVAAWAACADCARAIVQSGVRTLVRHDRSGVDRWNESIEAGNEILKAGGVEIIEVKGELGCAPVLANGTLWTP
jgi:dCMP deaminase